MSLCESAGPTIPLEVHPQKTHLETAVLTTHHHPVSPSEARNITGDGETKVLNHLGSLHLPQTEDSRVTGVCYQQCPQCCPGLTSQTGQGIPDKVGNTKKKPA